MVSALSDPVTPSVVRLSVASAGEASCDHLVPSQCSISAWLGNPVPVWPTAYTLLDETASSAYKALPPPFGSGAGTTDQAVPFQCSASVWVPPLASSVSPTAQMSVSESAAMPYRMFPCAPGLGLGITVQAVPSQC